MTRMEQVLAHYGLHPKVKSGQHRKYICPFHSEKDPSFVVSVHRRPDWAYCFGCNQSYGILDVVERLEGCTRSEAVQIANERWDCGFGSGEARREDPPQEEQLVRLAHRFALDRLEQVRDLWLAEKRYELTETDIRRFRVGYLPPDEQSDLERMFPTLKKSIAQLLGRILLPVQVPDGQVVGIWARKTDYASWKPEIKNVYVPLTSSRRKVPYLLSHYRWDRPLLLVEGAADALVATADLKELSAVAVGGMVSSITPQTFLDFHLDPPAKVIFVPDPDRAGEMDLIRHAPEITKAWGKAAFVLELPRGRDLDEALRIDGLGYEDLRTRISPLAFWIGKQRSAADASEPVVDLDDIVKSCAAEATEKTIEKQTRADADLIEILHQANALDDEEERKAFLAETAKAKGMTVGALIKALRSVLHEAYLAKEHDTVFLHPAMDISDNVASLGFRAEDIFLGKKEVFNIYVVSTLDENGKIELTTLSSNDSSSSVQIADKRYCIDKNECALPALEDTWGKEYLAAFLESPETQNPESIYQDLRRLYSDYIYLEYSEDYDILTSYTLMTYFHRIFPAIPFLLLYGNKESGKTRTASLLQRLCFSAQMVSRPSEAAMGDLLDGFRGTLIIDQAEFLSLKQFEPVVNFLAGTYTQDTGKRAIVQLTGKTGRKIRHFDCYGPKIFGATRDPHADLRDRLIVVPFLRPEDTSILAALKTPTSTSEDWQAWRGRLYALYLTQFAAMRDVARSLAQEQGNNNARRGELLRPMVAIMRFCRVDEDIIEEVCDRVEQRIDEIRPSITRLDEQVLMIVWEILHEQGGGYVEIPISSIRRRCAENEDLKIASYENVVWEILKRNGAYLKSKRRAGEIVIMTNERCVHRALERLGCDLDEISPSRGQDSLAPRQIAIPLARRAFQ
jgi:DNA primase